MRFNELTKQARIYSEMKTEEAAEKLHILRKILSNTDNSNMISDPLNVFNIARKL